VFAGHVEGSASKIGSQVIDRRLTLSADPSDPDAPFLPFDDRDGTPYRAVTWIERGVLKELAYDRRYAANALGEPTALLNSGSYRLQGAPDVPVTPISQMIASTQRGLLVTRFFDVTMMDAKSVLSAGYTRDGLWLIENGKITKPVKNFRFTDSPMFALNSIEAVGPTARVFSPGYARIAPALKIRQFNFTSLADAI
jgi:predicted Zn-dependent protease